MSASNLQKRLFFAAWAVPLGWWAVNSRLALLRSTLVDNLHMNSDIQMYPGVLLSIILLFVAASEYLNMLSISYPRNGFWLSYIWLGYGILSYFFPGLSLSSLYDTYILLLIVAVEAIFWGKNTGRWKRASLLFSGMVFLSIAVHSLIYLYREPMQSVFPRQFETTMLSQLGIMTVLASVFLCDTAAYFAGKYLGTHHFSRISPRKTVEGSVAGLIASITVMTLGWHFLASPRYPLVLGVLAGIIIGTFAQLGDLIVSLMKRNFHVKDASNIIPGHGGILDRFDSLFFTAPVLNLYLLVVTKVIG